LFRDATVAPLGKPSCDAITVAKRDLNVGDVLDGLGGFMCYALLDNYETARSENGLPMGLSEGCRLRRNVVKDHIVTYTDVELPKSRLCDRLRAEQDEYFFK
jgi:predicted homoserine dehydrogenase-like protein